MTDDLTLLYELQHMFKSLKEEKLKESGNAVCRKELEQIQSLIQANEKNADINWERFAENIKYVIKQLNVKEIDLENKTEPQPPSYSSFAMLWAHNASYKKTLSLALQQMLNKISEERLQQKPQFIKQGR